VSTEPGPTKRVIEVQWTPEAIKVEVDYRQRALRELAAERRTGKPEPEPRWWRWLRRRVHPRRESGH